MGDMERATEQQAQLPQSCSMTTFGIYLLIGKSLLARLGICCRLSGQELDCIMHACAGEPTLRCLLEDVLAARR
jgi:hypothetical protein